MAAQLLPEVRSKIGGATAPLLETMTDKSIVIPRLFCFLKKAKSWVINLALGTFNYLRGRLLRLKARCRLKFKIKRRGEAEITEYQAIVILRCLQLI